MENAHAKVNYDVSCLIYFCFTLGFRQRCPVAVSVLGLFDYNVLRRGGVPRILVFDGCLGMT